MSSEGLSNYELINRWLPFISSCYTYDVIEFFLRRKCIDFSSITHAGAVHYVNRMSE